jgi:hypothetical protein
MEADGQKWRVSYDTLSGRVTGRPAEEVPNGLSRRRFLLLLHLSHGFPGTVTTRWLWAIAVDVTFVSMVFWGLSGILMFWQIKATRHWGIAMIIGGTLIAVALGYGMHAEFLR